MTRFVMFFACCLCTAGTFGGAADAAMTSPDWPTDGAALQVASVHSHQTGIVAGTRFTGGTAGSGVTFVRGAEYPSWLPDAMRGLIPWWMGGKPGASVDDYSDYWFDSDARVDAEVAARYDIESSRWPAGSVYMEDIARRDSERGRVDVKDLNDDRSGDRYRDDR